MPSKAAAKNTTPVVEVASVVPTKSKSTKAAAPAEPVAAAKKDTKKLPLKKKPLPLLKNQLKFKM